MTTIILTVQLLDYLFIQGTLLHQFGGSPECLCSTGKQQVKMLSQQRYTAVILQNRGISVNIDYVTIELWIKLCVADSAMYLRAGMDVAMGEQVFVKSRQQLVEVRRRISLSLAIARQLLVTVFLQFPKCPLLYEHRESMWRSKNITLIHLRE